MTKRINGKIQHSKKVHSGRETEVKLFVQLATSGARVWTRPSEAHESNHSTILPFWLLPKEIQLYFTVSITPLVWLWWTCADKTELTQASLGIYEEGWERRRSRGVAAGSPRQKNTLLPWEGICCLLENPGLILWEARMLAMGNHLNLRKKTKTVICPRSLIKIFSRHLKQYKVPGTLLSNLIPITKLWDKYLHLTHMETETWEG